LETCGKNCGKQIDNRIFRGYRKSGSKNRCSAQPDFNLYFQ